MPKAIAIIFSHEITFDKIYSLIHVKSTNNVDYIYIYKYAYCFLINYLFLTGRSSEWKIWLVFSTLMWEKFTNNLLSNKIVLIYPFQQHGKSCPSLYRIYWRVLLVRFHKFYRSFVFVAGIFFSCKSCMCLEYFLKKIFNQSN